MRYVLDSNNPVLLKMRNDFWLSIQANLLTVGKMFWKLERFATNNICESFGVPLGEYINACAKDMILGDTFDA